MVYPLSIRRIRVRGSLHREDCKNYYYYYYKKKL